MNVVGFIGKWDWESHRAVWVAKERGIDFIIDDGLLIRGTQIIAEFLQKKNQSGFY